MWYEFLYNDLILSQIKSPNCMGMIIMRNIEVYGSVHKIRHPNTFGFRAYITSQLVRVPRRPLK